MCIPGNHYDLSNRSFRGDRFFQVTPRGYLYALYRDYRYDPPKDPRKPITYVTDGKSHTLTTQENAA